MALLELSDRIKEFIDYTKMSIRNFAIECGLKPPTFDKHVRGTAEPNVVTIIGIAERFPELSLEWLLLGKGDMLKDGSKMSDVNTGRLMKLVDTIATLQETINVKNDTIAILTNKIKELEQQINK